MKQNPPVFSKDISLSIKGIAILMMIAHHCFAFPEYWLDPVNVSPFLAGICSQFKICVAMYAFITGYGFYMGKQTTYKQTLGKVLDFLVQYWVQLFLIFLPIASVQFSFSAKRILYNMLALYDNVIVFAWYVFFHCFVLLTFPLIRKMMWKGPIWNLGVVLAGGYCVTVFFYFLPIDTPLFAMLLDCSIYYPVVGMGYLAARYSVFDRVTEKIISRIPAALLLIVVVLFLRSKIDVVKGFSLDNIYAPALILALSWILRECCFLQAVLAFLGKHSFHMWLFHAIFFSAYTRDAVQPLITWSNVPIVRFLLIVIMSTAAAFMMNMLWKSFMWLLHVFQKERLKCI